MRITIDAEPEILQSLAAFAFEGLDLAYARIPCESVAEAKESERWYNQHRALIDNIQRKANKAYVRKCRQLAKEEA